MTRHDTIVAGRGTRKRTIRVEKRRRLSRGDVHAIGLAAVADALCRAGGSIDGETRARLLGIRTSASVEKRDIGCATTRATKPENQTDLSTEGALLAARLHAPPISSGSQDGRHHRCHPDMGADTRDAGLVPDRLSVADRCAGPPAVIPGALVDDVCRHVHQGWFGRALWLGGVL